MRLKILARVTIFFISLMLFRDGEYIPLLFFLGSMALLKLTIFFIK